MMDQENKEENSINEIKTSLENLLNAKTSLKLKRSTKQDKEFEVFERIMNNLEELEVRSFILNNDIGLNLNEYDSKFYSIIDDLISIKFNDEISELIYFYLYERHSEKNGIINNLLDNEGKIIPLNNVMDLWNLIQIIEELKKRKKKINE